MKVSSCKVIIKLVTDLFTNPSSAQDASNSMSDQVIDESSRVPESEMSHEDGGDRFGPGHGERGLETEKVESNSNNRAHTYHCIDIMGSFVPVERVLGHVIFVVDDVENFETSLSRVHSRSK